jgi:hypothetical protein
MMRPVTGAYFDLPPEPISEAELSRIYHKYADTTRFRFGRQDDVVMLIDEVRRLNGEVARLNKEIDRLRLAGPVGKEHW